MILVKCESQKSAHKSKNLTQNHWYSWCLQLKKNPNCFGWFSQLDSQETSCVAHHNLGWRLPYNEKPQPRMERKPIMKETSGSSRSGQTSETHRKLRRQTCSCLLHTTGQIKCKEHNAWVCDAAGCAFCLSVWCCGMCSIFTVLHIWSVLPPHDSQGWENGFTWMHNTKHQNFT